MTDLVYNDRRSFLKSMGVAAGVAGAAGAATAPVLLSANPAAAAAPSVRAGEVASWGLELGRDAMPAGVFPFSRGGWPYFDIEEDEPKGDDAFTRKHIGGVKYEDIEMQVGPGMSGDFYDMIDSMLRDEHKPFVGSIVSLTSNFTTHSRIGFENALITEVSFPALDAASKDAAKMTVKLMPEATAFQHVIEKWHPASTAKQKKWLVSNFKVEIEGLDTTRVAKVDAFTVKLKVNEVPDAGAVQAAIEPGKIEFPNIVITVAETPQTADQFFKWWQSALESGEGGGDERTGKITWYAPDLKSAIGSLTLTNLGPVKISHDNGPAGESVRRVKCEMYVEEMSLKFNAAS